MPDSSTILVLLPYMYDTVPAQRFRWEQWIRLRSNAHDQVKILSFETESLAQFRKSRQWLAIAAIYIARYLSYIVILLGQARAADIVVIARNAVLGGPPLIEALLFLLGKKVVYDFDDAIFLAPPNDKSWLRRLLRCDWRVAYICRHACLVGVGNEFLASFARQYNPNVVIWPTTVDTDALKPVERKDREFTVGWTGSLSTVPYVESVLPAIAELQKSNDFRFLIVGGNLDLEAFGVRGQCKPWTPEAEVKLLQTMDIGLMPLNDTSWERGKCSLKAIQYQSVGIPAIVSDVGMNCVAVRNGETGIVLEPGGNWKTAIQTLLIDTEMRKKMGIAARNHVLANFSGKVVADRVFADITQFCA